MNPTRPCIGTLRAAIGLALASAAPLAAAQQAADPAAASACAALDSDPARLACYDALFKPRAGTVAAQAGTAQADAAAAQAKQVKAQQKELARETPRSERRGGNSDLYGVENGDAIANAGKGSLLDSAWELAKDSKLGTFNMRAYKPVYLLPAFWTSKVNDTPSSPNPDNSVTTPQELSDTELKFQLSFKTKAVENLFGDNGDIWMGYTQSSHWQAYNSEQSRPFRETNYEPEVLLVFRNNYHLFGWNGRMSAIGINHQSNGRSDPLSRSWNRVMLNFGLDRPNWTIMFRPWYRVPESRRDDNNPDIEDYMGRGDVTVVHTIGEHQISLMGRHSFRSGDRSHGALQLDWGFPLTNQLRGHLQLFDGYGESMIDYNHRAFYVGLGVSLLEWY